MGELPGGTVTFLLTDVEGSTRRWEEDRRRMSAAVADLDALVERAVGENRGHVVKPRGEGDSHFCVFAGAGDAIAAAVALQRALSEEELSVRIAIHTGEADLRDGDYYGPTVNRAARLRAIGHGGQILVSATAADVVRNALPEGAALRDLGEHRLKDLTEPERVAQVVASAIGESFPPLASLDADRHNLPIQLTSLVGREEDAAEVRAAVEASRLVSVTGAGGSGKTRLALQVAADILDQFTEGVWFADLSTITDPDLVATRVAEAVGAPQEPGGEQSPREIVLDFVRGRSMLIVLDNCEHLIAESAEMATALLKSGAALRILATTREALGVSGELIWLVPSLDLPDPDEPAEDIARRAAVRLFVERARLKRRGYELTDDDAPFVAQVCRRLDGIPLAIELAAGKIGVLSAEQIATRLDDRFRLLTGGRGAVARQQTLQATVEWSYGLLSPTEQTVLRRAAVFAGGFDLDAAVAVCSEPQLDAFEQLEQLASKSLVVVDTTVSPPRYRLLETVRQFAAARLLDADETGAARDRYASHFTERAARLAEDLVSSRQAAALLGADRDLDNYRAAMSWTSAETRMSRLELCCALGRYFQMRGLTLEHHEVLLSALSDAEETADPGLRARVYLLLAARDNEAPHIDEVAAWAQKVLDLHEVLVGHDRVWLAVASAYSAHRRLMNQVVSAAAALAESARTLDDAEFAGATDYEMAQLLLRHAHMADHAGEPELAISLHERTAELASRAGVPSLIAHANYALALNALLHDDDAEVERLCMVAEEAQRQLGLLGPLMNSMFLRSVHADRTGDHEGADQIRAEVEKVARKIDQSGPSAGQLNVFGYRCLFVNRLEAASTYFARGVERSSNPLMTANLSHSRGEGLLIAGDLDAAESWLRRALEAWTEMDSMQSTHAVHDLANVARLRGDLVTAARDYATVLEARRQVGGGNELSQSLTDIASLALAAGDHDIAARLGGVMARRGRTRCRYYLANHARAVWALCRAADRGVFEEARAELTDDAATELALSYCHEVAARGNAV